MVDDKVIGQIKECLAGGEGRIHLHDIVVAQIKAVAAQTMGDDFRVQGVAWTEDEFQRRIAKYDAATRSLCAVQALLGYWATDVNRSTLTLPLRRLVEGDAELSGVPGWRALRWYPALTALYAGGTAACAADSYDNLRELLHTRVVNRRGDEEPFVLAVIKSMKDVVDAFKLLPDRRQEYVARSEHLFETMRPVVDDLLFLGADYESAFDRFEVIASLEYSHLNDDGWGPLGRFAWKAGRNNGPLQGLVAEGSKLGDNWLPLRAGLFGGSAERFKDMASRLTTFVSRLSWH